MFGFNCIKFVTNEIFVQLGKSSISDIQICPDQLTYAHTKKGLEIIYSLREVPGKIVMKVQELLYARQGGNNRNNAESKLQEQASWKERLGEFNAVDFSCEEQEFQDGPVSGRLRVQAHLSLSGLGVTGRVLNDEIADIDRLGIDGDTVRVLRGFFCKRQGLGLVTGQSTGAV